MKPKTIIKRIVLEVLILLFVFSAVDNLTSPSQSTAAAVTQAVSKNQLEPICMVEVRSAIRSASFTSVALLVVGVAAIGLLCSDVWALWQSRRENRSDAQKP